MSIIKIEALGHAYGSGPPTLKDISFEIQEGERVAFVGPSGCGKTTLLRILAGLLELQEGSLVLGGQKVNSLDSLGRLSLVFQDANLLPWRRVCENIRLPLELRGEKVDEGVLNELISRVNLLGTSELYPDELSGGMKMRVSLARAFLTRPDVLLLDEPFGALDELTREIMAEELLRLWNEDRPTTFLITHDIAEAIYLSDRVYVMDQKAGALKGSFSVDEPHQRDRAWREGVEFLELRREVSASLRGEG
jgi:NitT/TauT family transport system ATP-binding protein